MSGINFLLDSGHGGMQNGKYVTAPNKMFKHKDFTFYEGQWNRWIVYGIAEELKKLGIKHTKIVEGYLDIPLRERVKYANKLHRRGKCIYISVHSNASPSHTAHGFEVFTSPGETKSDEYATVFCDEIESKFPTFRLRKDLSDGDPDKEAAFYVLTKTHCPALLTENLFYDNYKEAVMLMDPTFQKRIIDYHVRAIEKIDNV